jgi:hypothetical protein
MIRAIIRYLLQTVESLLNGMYALGSGLQHIAHSGYKTLTTIISYAANNAFDWIKYIAQKSVWLVGNIGDIVSKLLNAVATLTLNALRALGHTFNWIATNLLHATKAAIIIPGQLIVRSGTSLGSLIYSGCSNLRQSISALNRIVMSLLGSVYTSITTSTSSLQNTLAHVAHVISSYIQALTTRTVRAFLGIGNTLQLATRSLASFLTRSLAWVIFKVLGGLTNILDVAQAISHALYSTLNSIFTNISAIPRALIQSLLSLYTTLNELLSNLLASLMTREWAFVSALQQSFSSLFSAISYILKSIAHGIVAAAIFITLDLPRSIFGAISGTLTSIWSSFNHVSPSLQTMGSVSKSALSGTAGFLFLDIPRGLWNNLNAFTRAIIHAISNALATTAHLTKNIFIDLPAKAFKAAGSSISSIGRYIFASAASLTNKFNALAHPLLFAFPLRIVNITRTLPSTLAQVFLAIYTFLGRTLWNIGHMLFVSIPRHVLAACMLVAHSTTSVAGQALTSIKNGCSALLQHLFVTLPHGAFNSAKFVGTKVHSGIRSTHAAVAPKISTAHTATKQALAGTAGFLFISVPQNIFSGITSVLSAASRLCISGYIALKDGISYLFKVIFVHIPQTLWNATKHTTSFVGSGVRATHSVVTPKLITAHAATQKALMGAAGFIFLEVPRSLTNVLRALGMGTYTALLSCFYGLKTAAAWTGTVLFISFPNTLFYGFRTVFQAFLSALTTLVVFIHQGIRKLADITLMLMRLTNAFFRMIGTAGRIFIESILGIPRQIALAVVALAHLALIAAQALLSTVRATWDGICYLATAPLLAIRHALDMLYARAHRTYHATKRLVYDKRSRLQTYAFLGTSIYLGLVLFSTHNVNYSKPSAELITPKHTVHTHATPVTVDLEVHNLQPSSEGFGCISIEGVLSYSYNTGTEPAKAIDDFTITNARQYSLKKLSSSVNHERVTTTRYALAATLSPHSSTAATFPFSGSQSYFVMHNNSLSAREIHYQGTQRTLTAESGRNLGLQKILMEPGENKLLARSEHASMPELTITLEYQRWSPYILFGLYLALFMMIFLSIASLRISEQGARLSLSGITFCLQGLIWLGCYLVGMLITVNHLMITLLIGLALNTLVIALNTSARNTQSAENSNPLYAEGQFEGQTRWIFILLSMLAITLTMLIRL